MQLPRLRLPRLSLSFDWLGALPSRTTILYVGYTLGLFLVFLLVTFPHELLVRRALSNVNRGAVGVEFNTVNFAWHKGYELTSVKVKPNGGDGATPYLECTHFFVRPALSQLVRGNPYAMVVSADLYGGSADGEVSLTEGALTGNLAWHDLNIGRYRTLTALLDEGQLSGLVSGQLSFEARGPGFSQGQGSGDLAVDGAALTGAKVSGFSVPDLKLRQTKAKFKLSSGRVEVQDLTTSGDVTIQASGQIVMREPFVESQLNLRATFATTPTTPDAVKGALALIPRAPGAKPDAPVTITGTLSKPRIR